MLSLHLSSPLSAPYTSRPRAAYHAGVLPLLSSLLLAAAAVTLPPVVLVTRDDTSLTTSCTVAFPPGAVIPDANGDGVLHIDADDITVEFAAGAVLQGAPASTPPDQLAGIGIRVDGRRGVTLRNARVSGYKVGVLASRTATFTVDGADLSGNFRQRLKSTPKAEDESDWLSPHDNDGGQWLAQYGAALYLQESHEATVRGVRVRRGQNGIVLDRVTRSRLFDNDCSFLSGWGLALWRSSDNVISRNAFDFCVRGYAHGAYNRGQDSAGILMFEQSSRNVIAENSATHGGDGLFGFAGKEAIGDTPAPTPGFDYRRRGNNGNLILGNDFSYAAAHGIEMTFSHGNVLAGNRLVENAICGVWGGYSQDTLIAGNTFEGNGQAGYGLERGGVNIEHGADNVIAGNTFRRNAAGVHLWWDDDGALLRLPGVAANDRDVTGNVVAGNSFDGDGVALHLRDESPGKDRVRGTVYAANRAVGVKQELDVPPGVELVTTGAPPRPRPFALELPGRTRPVGARAALAGRQNILLTEWGPYEHEGPLVRPLDVSGPRHTYELYGLAPASVSVTGKNVRAVPAKHVRGQPWRLSVEARTGGVWPYRLRVTQGSFRQELRGAVVQASWALVFFPWEGTARPPAPPANLTAWRDLAQGPGAARGTTDNLSLLLGKAGPSALGLSPEITAARFDGRFYGLIASTRLSFPAGKWRLRTVSDDGVRVLAGGEVLLENWNPHGPTTDTAVLELPAATSVELTVEHFQVQGRAVLDFAVEPVMP